MIKKGFIFLGAPGVGKGTVAAILADKKGMKHISTGEIFRNEIANETELGLKVKALLAAGEYVPDEVTNAIVKGVLQSAEVQAKGFILDGYPRTINQAEFLKNNGIKIDAAVLLSAPDELVIKRLLGRGRADDNAEIIENRIKVYNEKTMPLIDFYKNENLLVDIDATGTVEENYENLIKGIF